MMRPMVPCNISFRLLVRIFSRNRRESIDGVFEDADFPLERGYRFIGTRFRWGSSIRCRGARIGFSLESRQKGEQVQPHPTRNPPERLGRWIRFLLRLDLRNVRRPLLLFFLGNVWKCASRDMDLADAQIDPQSFQCLAEFAHASDYRPSGNRIYMKRHNLPYSYNYCRIRKESC